MSGAGFMSLAGGGALSPGVVSGGVMVLPPLAEESTTDDDVILQYKSDVTGVEEEKGVLEEDKRVLSASNTDVSECANESRCVDSLVELDDRTQGDCNEGALCLHPSSSKEGSPEQETEEPHPDGDNLTEDSTEYCDAKGNSSKESTPEQVSNQTSHECKNEGVLNSTEGDSRSLDSTVASPENELTSLLKAVTSTNEENTTSTDTVPGMATTPPSVDQPDGARKPLLGSSAAAFGMMSASTDADSEPGDPVDWPPIFLAATTFNFEEVNNLLQSGAASDEEIHLTVDKGRNLAHEMVLSFLDLDQVEQSMYRPRLVEILSLLVQKDLNINQQDKKLRTPLHHLASTTSNQVELIKAFQACGAKVNIADTKQQTSLHRAALRGCHENVEALLMGGANPNQQDGDGRTALHLACKGKRQLPTVQRLLQCAAQPDMRDGFGRTALHVATKAARPELVLELVTAGRADVNMLDNSGQSALHLATTYDVTGEVLRHLVYHEGDINMQDTVALETPLHKAIRLHMHENLLVLVKAGVDPNIADVRGDTPVHLASRIRDVLLWKDLIQLKANVHVRNCLGHTPFLNAHRAKNQMAVCMMQQHGLVE